MHDCLQDTARIKGEKEEKGLSAGRRKRDRETFYKVMQSELFKKEKFSVLGNGCEAAGAGLRKGGSERQ
jgi:hypothetical protein